MHTCLRTSLVARVDVRAHRVWVTTRGSEVGYLVRERNGVEENGAWFVFEVESTLHLLFPSYEGGAHRPSRITSSESLANSPSYPAILVSRYERAGRSSSRPRPAGRFINNSHINRRVWISLRSSTSAARCPNRKAGLFMVFVVLEVLLAVIKLDARRTISRYQIIYIGAELGNDGAYREERLRASMPSRN